MLNRHFRVGTLALALLSAVLTGCGMSGTAIPMVSDQPLAAYRAQLSPLDQQILAARDQERRLDPCGFVDAPTLATLGRPVYVGPAQDFDVCAIEYPRGAFSVDVTVGQWAQLPIRTMDIDGVERIGVTPTGSNTCAITVPYRPRPFTYSLTSRNGTNACDSAIAFVRSALPLLKTTPLRMNSKVSLNTPLTRLDPCAVLSVIAKGRPRLQVNTDVTPYNCDFYLDSDVHSTRQELTENQKPLSLLAADRKFGRVIDINGAAAAFGESTTPGHCELDLFPDTAHPVPRFNDQWVDEIEMDGDGGCDALKQTAGAIVDLYRNVR